MQLNVYIDIYIFENWNERIKHIMIHVWKIHQYTNSLISYSNFFSDILTMAFQIFSLKTLKYFVHKHANTHSFNQKKSIKYLLKVALKFQMKLQFGEF